LKHWADFVNERDDTHYIPWTDCCPYCGQASPIAWEGYENTKLDVFVNVFYCVDCGSVLNWSEDDPKATVRWLSTKEARDLGIVPLEEDETMQ
jgi:hypothetical protein